MQDMVGTVLEFCRSFEGTLQENCWDVAGTLQEGCRNSQKKTEPEQFVWEGEFPWKHLVPVSARPLIIPEDSRKILSSV